MSLRAITSAGFFFVSALAMAACEPEIPRPQPSPEHATAVPLPPSPALVRPEYKMLNADGTLTVEGLLQERDRYLGKSVEVRGTVKKVTHCKTIKNEGETEGENTDRQPCNPPAHAYLIDQDVPESQQVLIYAPSPELIADYEEGKEVTATGHFDIVSEDGVYLRQGGLVVLQAPKELLVDPEAELEEGAEPHP